MPIRASKTLCELGGETAILNNKSGDDFCCLYHVGTRLKDLENTISPLKSLVPFLLYWPYWKISDLFEFYTRNTSFLTFPIQGTRDLGGEIVFSRSSSLVLTWYKQQKSSPDLLLNIAVSPPSASVLRGILCIKIRYQNFTHILHIQARIVSGICMKYNFDRYLNMIYGPPTQAWNDTL